MAKTKVEDIYKEMDEISHILNRSGMWVGSTKSEEKQLYIYNADTDKMQMQDVHYVPAMLKIFDEVLSNSCDEFRRSTNMGLDKIEVSVWKSGKIIVKDNGGIPIVMHKDAGCYVPQFIFGKLRTSSNYDDSEDRTLIGTNGVGSALANVFSKKFTIDSADGKNSFHRSWSNNMRKLNDDLKVEPCKDHFTQTTFEVDLDRFEVDNNEFSDDFIAIMEKRCIDAAAANFGLTVLFKYYETGRKPVKESKWKFRNFEQYIKLFEKIISLDDCIKFSDDVKQVWIYPDGNLNVGFVDGAECSQGTHIKGIRQPINSTIAEFITKKKKMDVKPSNVDNKYSMFCVVNVVNPAYDSQTKECLTTPCDKFSREPNYKFTVPEDFLKKCLKSEIIETVMDWYRKKSDAEDEKTLRKLNKEAARGLKRSDKYIPANSKKKQERELWIYEGDSAARGLRTGRNPLTQAGYLMRGVVPNSLDMTSLDIMKNDVFNDLVTIIGLKFGDEFNVDDLNFGKIVISTDADVDGDKIAALLLLLFKRWPALFEHNIICRSISPIIIAKKGKETRKYYSIDKFNKEESKLKSGWMIKYVKGLSGLTTEETKEMMHNPIFMYFNMDNKSEEMFSRWFGKDSNQRKQLMEM